MNFNEVGEKNVVDLSAENGSAHASNMTELTFVPLSIEAVKPTFAAFVTIVNDRIREARDIVVSDEDSQKAAIVLVGDAKRIIKDIDASKRALPSYKEAKGFLDSLNAFTKALTDKFTKIVELADPKVRQYASKIELERREAEKKAQEATRKLQEDINKEAAAKGVEAPTVLPAIMPKKETITRTETGTAAFTKHPWKYEILDMDAVPRSFCMPDVVKIRDAIKMGTREIPGVRIYQEAVMNYRR